MSVPPAVERGRRVDVIVIAKEKRREKERTGEKTKEVSTMLLLLLENVSELRNKQ